MNLLPWREEIKRRGRFTFTSKSLIDLPSPVEGEGFG